MNKERMKWIITGLDWDLLDDWEERFVEGVERFYRENGRLSDRQEEVLEQIYRQKGRGA